MFSRREGRGTGSKEKCIDIPYFGGKLKGYRIRLSRSGSPDGPQFHEKRFLHDDQRQTTVVLSGEGSKFESQIRFYCVPDVQYFLLASSYGFKLNFTQVKLRNITRRALKEGGRRRMECLLTKLRSLGRLWRVGQCPSPLWVDPPNLEKVEALSEQCQDT